MQPGNPRDHPRRILLAVTGLSPQVVTETLYALTQRQSPPFVPTEIHLITTGKGAEHARLNLLSPSIGWFHRLLRDWKLPSIDFSPTHIHVIEDADGRPLEDIRIDADNTRAADFITARVAELTSDPHSALHVSLAGGRKTMGYYLGYALSLFGRPQDRLSHVLVSAPYENHREFYYPTPAEHAIHVREGGKEIAYDCRNARVDLAEIPFVRLRDGLPRRLLDGRTTFSEAVAAAQHAGRSIELVIDTKVRSATASGVELKLSPQNFTLLAWLARRRRRGQGPVQCSNKNRNIEAAREYIDLCRTLHGEFAAETELTERALQHGMGSDWFSPAKNRLHKALVRALGETGAEPYRIQPVGGRRAARFELALEPESIRFP